MGHMACDSSNVYVPHDLAASPSLTNPSHHHLEGMITELGLLSEWSQ
jgi:hypothetical protein